MFFLKVEVESSVNYHSVVPIEGRRGRGRPRRRVPSGSLGGHVH